MKILIELDDTRLEQVWDEIPSFKLIIHDIEEILSYEGYVITKFEEM